MRNIGRPRHFVISLVLVVTAGIAPTVADNFDPDQVFIPGEL